MRELGPLVSVIQAEEAESSGEQAKNLWDSIRDKFKQSSRSEREQDLWEKRELLIKFVRAEYDDMIDHRAVILPPERHEASRLLLNSTLYAMDDLSNLGDWEVIENSIQANKYYLFGLKVWDWLAGSCQRSGSKKLKYLYKRRQDAYAMLLR